jgi:hypothetical protein
MATSTPAPATSTGTSTGSTTAARRPNRRPPVPGRRALVGASAMVALGSFMPWVDTSVGAVSGMVGAGLWTFYASWIGVAGALIPKLRLAAVHAVVLGVIALVLSTWQVVHLLQLVGFSGWSPGVGLVFVVGGGVLACVAGTRLFRAASVAPPA